MRLTAGAHRVVFEYRPRLFPYLLALSYATILWALAAAWWLARRPYTSSR